MRFVLVALLAALGCSRTPTAATPANKAPAPDHERAASDELAFLTIDADFIFGLDLVALRKSQLWHAFEPQIDAFMRKVQQEYGSGCGDDFLDKLERATISVKVGDGNQFSGVVVMHGGDSAKALQCSVEEAKRKGGTVTTDRGVTITTNPTTPGLVGASQAVGSSTLVMHLDKAANYDSLAAVIAAGVPLRKSPAFMQLFERRERGSAFWGMANGNASVFSQLASSGMKFKSIDGTLVVTDRLTGNLRMTMASTAEATSIAGEIDKVKGMAASYVERLDTRVDGSVVVIQVSMTEAQLRNLIGQLGALAGP